MTSEQTPSFEISSPDLLEAVLSSLNDGVFCVDQNWKVILFNQAAQMITGISREQAIGKQCCEVLRSNICENACALRYTMETGRPVVNLAITITNTEEAKIPISISTSLLKNSRGEVVGGVETFRDLRLVEQLRRELEARHTFQDIISKSPKMRHLFDMIPVVADSDSTVLITGESGTGKGLVAKAIHFTSPRQDGPLITVNCSAMPETLLESELFGYKKGAFTDARRDKPGRFAAAEGGTLFLDEIGDIPPSIQMKLLRVIQEKVYEPLGGTKSVSADVRILSATNKNLEQLVKEERFRMDLYYRINVIRLELPPLSERSEDVPLLVNHFIARFSSIKGKDIEGIVPDAMNILMRHEYPGNVRELENIVEHAFVLCPGGMIRTNHLPEYLQPKIVPPESGALQLLQQYEKELILEVLRRNHWNRDRAARELGIHKTTLFRKIQKLGLQLPKQDGRSKK